MEYFGDKLRALRTSKGLTQSQLAKKLGLVNGTISAYEQGLKYPSITVLIKICEIFDISADYMLGLSDNIPTQMGGLSENQMQPFLQIIAMIEQYNNLKSKE